MKKSLNRPSWLLLAIFPALLAALFLAECNSKPEESCVGCGEEPKCDNPPCDNTCDVPPCDSVPPDTCDVPPCTPTDPPDTCDVPPCDSVPPDTCDVPPCDSVPPPPPPPTYVDSVYLETAAGLNTYMTFVKGGTMKIGCSDDQCESNERYAHTVEIGSYYIGKFLVTQRQWAALMGANPSNFSGDDGLPVEMVSWDDAQAFIEKLNERSSRPKYRLPTNAEWEYAARGGTESKGYKYSGGDIAGDVAWHTGNSGGNNNGYTRPVGGKAPNELGLYDMSGNLYEWVSDWYESSYGRGQFVNPQGPASSDNGRVIRGGSWAQDTIACRVSARTYLQPAQKRKFVGFRLALSAE